MDSNSSYSSSGLTSCSFTKTVSLILNTLSKSVLLATFSTLIISILQFVFFVSFYDGFDKFMPHYVFRTYFDHANTFNILQNLQRFAQAGFLPRWQIHLRLVTGYNDFGVGSHSGQEHFDLFAGGVLGFIQ